MNLNVKNHIQTNAIVCVNKQTNAIVCVNKQSINHSLQYQIDAYNYILVYSTKDTNIRV